MPGLRSAATLALLLVSNSYALNIGATIGGVVGDLTSIKLGAVAINGCTLGFYPSQKTGTCLALPTCAITGLAVGTGASQILDVFAGTCVTPAACQADGSAFVDVLDGLVKVGGSDAVQISVCKKIACATNYLLSADTGKCVYCDPKLNVLTNGVCQPKTCGQNYVLNSNTGVCDYCDPSTSTIANGVCKLITCVNEGQIYNAAFKSCICKAGTTLVPGLAKCMPNPVCSDNAVISVDVLKNSLVCACVGGYTLSPAGICVSILQLNGSYLSGVLQCLAGFELVDGKCVLKQLVRKSVKF